MRACVNVDDGSGVELCGCLNGTGRGSSFMRSGCEERERKGRRNKVNHGDMP